MSIYEAEANWATQLREASLVIQVSYDDQEALRALRHIGKLIKNKVSEEVLRSHPAGLLVGLNCVASGQYQSGTLWPQILASMDYLDASHEGLIANLHRQALNTFGLERFEHPLGRIGEILLHAGIPVQSQSLFIRRLIKDYRYEREFTAQTFCNSIRLLSGDQVQSNQINKPIWHFINQAGSVAEDFVDSCIEVLDDLRDGEHDGKSGAGLPQRIIDEIIRVVSEIGAGNVRRAEGRSDRISSPFVSWPASFENELLLSLPRVPDVKNGPVKWRVEIDGLAEQLIDVPQAIQGISNSSAEAAIRKPTSLVSATYSGFSSSGVGQTSTRSWLVSLYEEESPIVIFDGDGRANSGKGPLDPTSVKILYPKLNTVGKATELTVEGTHSIQPIGAPLGWDALSSGVEWAAVLVDIRQSEAIQFRYGTSRPYRRAVSALRKPKFRDTGLVTGVYDSAGNAVYSSAPELEVGTLASADDVWTIEVRDSERNLIDSFHTHPEAGIVRVPQNVSFDGQHHFKFARGLGQSQQTTRTVISGLSAEFTPRIRHLSADGNGLANSKAKVTNTQGQVRELTLSPREILRALSDESFSQTTLMVRPQYEMLELFNSESGRKSEWITPTRCNIEHLQSLQLTYTSEEQSSPALLASWSDDTTQVIEPKASQSKFKFALGELAGNAALHGAFEYTLIFADGRRVAAGSCYPKNLFHDFLVAEDLSTIQLDFVGGGIPNGLEICFFAPRAPWVAPRRQVVNQAVIDIPADLLSFGSLAFSVAVSSPWAPHDFGSAPERDDPNTVFFETLPPNPELSPEQALCHLLVTGESTALVLEIDAALAWTSFFNHDLIRTLAGISPWELEQLAISVLQSKSDAIASYPGRERLQHEVLLDLIQSEVIAAPGQTVSTLPSELNLRPALAVVGSSGSMASEHLADLISAAASDWGFMEPTKEDQDPDVVASDYTGLVEQKLRLLNMAHLVAMFGWPEEQIEELTQYYLPGKLLSGSTMFGYFRRMALDVDEITTSMGARWHDDVYEHFSSIEETLSVAHPRICQSRPLLSKQQQDLVLGIRKFVVNWPAYSVRFALLTRLASRGDVKAGEFFRAHKKFLIRLASALPGLFEADLVLIEIYLQTKEGQR